MYEIYCDMDGVLTDFRGDYKKLTGIEIDNQNHRHDESFYKPLIKAGKSFWSDMNWTKDGKKLWEYINKYNPILLSSPIEHESCSKGKKEWVQKELPGVKLILKSSSLKREYAKENRILIDDKISNILEWEEDGGIAIYHTSSINTINKLKLIGL